MTNQLYTDNMPHMAPVWTRIFNFVADHAEGSYIYTDDGRKLLDFTCGIGVTNTGHCHPKVVEAIHGALKGARGWLKVAGLRSLLRVYDPATKKGIVVPGFQTRQ